MRSINIGDYIGSKSLYNRNLKEYMKEGQLKSVHRAYRRVLPTDLGNNVWVIKIQPVC